MKDVKPSTRMYLTDGNLRICMTKAKPETEPDTEKLLKQK
jgi:hypothetical protein